MRLAIDELKATARKSTDIEYWVQENLSLFGILPPSSTQDVMVSIGYSTLDVLNYYDLDDPVIRSHVQISVDYRQPENPELDKLLCVVATDKSERLKKFDMLLHFNDWPFLVATLAMGKLNDHFDISKTENQLLDDVLTKYLPIHFPGITWGSLQSLHAADLLPIDENIDRLDAQSFLDMLFLRRAGNTDAALPHTLSFTTDESQ